MVFTQQIDFSAKNAFYMKAANRTGTEKREPVHIEKSVNRVNRTAWTGSQKAHLLPKSALIEKQKKTPAAVGRLKQNEFLFQKTILP